MTTAVVWGLIGVALFAVAGCARPDTPGDVIVFAAASLTDVAADLEAAYEDAHPGARVRVSVGSTPVLARQIAQGAPAAVFLAADPAWIDTLEADGYLDGAAVQLARGRLVVIGPPGGAASPTLAAALDGAERIALADPASVPAGQYARTALVRAGLWEAAESRVIPTSDVRAAVAAVETGAADAALVYASDAQSSTSLTVRYRLAPDQQPAIRFAGAVVRGGGGAGAAFLALARERPRLWASRGFLPPPP